MWEIFHLGFAMPYGKITKVQDLIEFLRNGRRLDIPQFCPKNLYDLMIKCWNEDPFSRYTSNHYSVVITTCFHEFQIPNLVSRMLIGCFLFQKKKNKLLS